MGNAGDRWTLVQHLEGPNRLRSLPMEQFNRLLPLPHNPSLETPAGFGSPVSMDVIRTLARPTWLIAEFVDVSMGANTAVSYYATLGYERC